jgi:uncharacterized protein YqjF (DUF2071 family)
MVTHPSRRPGALGRLAAAAARVAEVNVLPPALHRPWPLPSRPWVMAQTWTNLLFAHWPVSPSVLRPLIPRGLTLETVQGSAWVGITPFVLTRLRPRGLPPIPGLSEFPEINVRTYVTAGGKPGVFFFSLDAAHRPAVIAARALYSLPYHRARMTVCVNGDTVEYASTRAVRGMPPAEFRATYRPAPNAAMPCPDALTTWLTERYCLYALDRRSRLHRAEIHHVPWPLGPATAEIRLNTMTTPLGVDLPDEAPLLHFAACLDVYVWPPERVARADT